MSFYQEYLKKKKPKKTIKEEAPDFVPPQANSDKKKKFSDIQKREEEERQKFLSRVKGENVPPKIIKDKFKKEENVSINVPPRPRKSEKILIRVIIIFILVIILATISLFWYRSIKDIGAPPEIIEKEVIVEVLVPEVIAPKSLFNYNRFEYPLITRSNEFSAHLLSYMAEKTEEESITKIMFRDQRNPKNPSFITSRSFLETFSITMPPPFNNRVDQGSLNVFVHSSDGINNTGFAVIINEIDGFTGMMREWEDDAAENVYQFLSLLGKETKAADQIFSPITHEQREIRCLAYQDGSDICYSILKSSLTNIFVFTTSSDTLKALIDSL